MNINGHAIRHKTFGSGVITAFTESIITISFSEGEKKFIYPDAFKEHLVLKDKKMQAYITAQIAEKKAEINRQRQIEQSEQERRKKLLNFTITANSHAVFDVAPDHTLQVCEAYTVSTGQYLSGYSKGQPKIAVKLKPNSACLFTERAIGKSEQERRIIGAFMVREDFFGEDSRDGLIVGHPKHRMLIPAGNPLFFWELFGQGAMQRWGNIAFKYCSSTEMNYILSQMVQILANTDQQESAFAFYKYFCAINRLSPLIEIETMETLTEL